MRSLSQKIGAILLAQLLLFSTLSFTMDMHFCGKILVDFSLFHPAEDCGMSAMSDLMADMGCCSDVELAVQGQDQMEQAASLPELQVQVAAIFQAVYTYVLPDLAERQRDIPFDDYSPPPRVTDIPVRDQRFLI